MLLKLKADELKVVDDKDRPVKPQMSNESDEIVVRPDNPVAEINLNLEAPERSAARIKSLKVKAELTIPAGVKVFRFPSLAQENVTVKQADVSRDPPGHGDRRADLEGPCRAGLPGRRPRFRELPAGIIQQPDLAPARDGSRFEQNGGFNSTGGGGGKLGFEYLFVDAPGKPADYQLVYETPSKVITIPLEFEFKDIPLP